MLAKEKYFLATIVSLILVGFMMVFSSSYLYSIELKGYSYYFVLKQVIVMMIGLVLAYIISKTKSPFWIRISFGLNLIVSFFVLLTLLPGTQVIKGATRWIQFGGVSFQPGEFLKLSFLLSSIQFFFQFHMMNMKTNFWRLSTFLIPLVFLLMQPDFGTFSICLFIFGFIGYISPFKRRYFYSGLIVGFISFCLILIAEPYRIRRLMTYLDPWKDPLNSGFQIIQSFFAFANGGIVGLGAGNSHEKLFYLPEAHNDFIFSVIGEEFGFIGVCLVIGLYLLFAYIGFQLSLRSYLNLKNRVLISGSVLIIAFQAFLHMAVVLGILPTKGLNLPFISYGGSSLLLNMVLIGIILSGLKIKSQAMEEDSFEKKSWSQ